MESPVNIAVIGAGFGQQVHVPAFRSVPGCKVHSICARNLEHAQRAARVLDIPRASNDWRELVNDPEVHALALAVPPSSQAEIALAAARAGKHLFCEKPLALHLAQARQIVNAADKSRIVHAMDFIFGEIPAWLKMHELLGNGTVGKIRHVALTWRTETYTYRTKSHNWKTHAAEGGGTLNNFASHSLYYFEWLFGPIERLSGYLSPRESEVEARVDAWLEFAAGFSATVSISADAFLGSGHKLEVFGESGTLVLENTTSDYANGFRLFFGNREAGKLAPVEVQSADMQKDGRIQPVSRIAGRFIEAILQGWEVTPNLRHGTRVQALIDALRLAHKNGSWQTLPGG